MAALSNSIFDGDGGALDYYLDDRLGDVNNLLASLLVPIAAGFLTWEVSKLRKSDALHVDAAKSRLRSISRAATPTVVVAFAVFALAQAWHVSRVPTSARGLLALVLPYLVLISVLAFWSAVAIRTAPVLAVPSSVLGTWLAIAYPPSLGWVWPRHMTGTLSGCCAAHEALAIDAMGATLLLATALVIVAAALSSKRPVLWVPAALLTLVGLLALGIRMVEPLGWESVDPRPASELECEQHGSMQVCLWPEHGELFGAVGTETAAIRDSLTGFGIEIPATFTEAPDAAEWFYDKRIDRNVVPTRRREHTWARQLHPQVLEVPGALRAQLMSAVIPRPVCRTRRTPPGDERRSTEKLAPVAQAVVWHIVAGDTTGQSALTEGQRQGVEYIVAEPDRAARFVETSIEAVIGCDPVDADDLYALAD